MLTGTRVYYLLFILKLLQWNLQTHHHFLVPAVPPNWPPSSPSQSLGWSLPLSRPFGIWHWLSHGCPVTANNDLVIGKHKGPFSVSRSLHVRPLLNRSSPFAGTLPFRAGALLVASFPAATGVAGPCGRKTSGALPSLATALL